jgi:uncharacterized phiE125 gp8 family phage protein
MYYKTTTAATVEPVTLAEAKLWLRVDGATDDALITSLIAAARDYCQQYEGRAYVEQTITAYYDDFEDKLTLPMPPVLTVESVKYLDTDKVWQTLSTDYYTVRNEVDPAYIEFDFTGTSYTLADVDNRVEVVLTAGYTYEEGDAWEGAVPDRVKSAIMLLVGHWYEHRLASCEAQLKEIPMGVHSLLSERIWLAKD